MIVLACILAGLAVTATGGLIAFALKNSSARDERESARVLASSTGSELRVARDTIESLKRNLKSEQERADALDDELASTYDSPNPDGARDRVLRAWKLSHDNARGRTITVSAPPAALAAESDDALLKPGD